MADRDEEREIAGRAAGAAPVTLAVLSFLLGMLAWNALAAVLHYRPGHAAAVGIATALALASLAICRRNRRRVAEELAAEMARRESADAALRESEERFRLMTEYGSDIVTVLDHDGVITYESPSVTPILGFLPGHRVGRSCFEDIHPDDRSTIRQRLARLTEGEERRVTAEYRYRHNDGSWRWLESSACLLPPGSVLTGFIVNTHDVTARREAEAALLRVQEEIEARIAERTRDLARTMESLEIELAERRRASEALRVAEARYRDIFENAGEGIFQTTADGRYLSVNPALARIYGYDSPEDLTWNLVRIADQLYVQPGRREEFVRLMNENDTVPRFESEIRRKDGEIIWITENVRAVRDAGGRLLYYEGLVQDITERKRAETEIRTLNEQLQRRLSRIAALHTIDQAITSSMDIRLTLGVALTQVLEQLRVDAADILLYDRPTHLLERIVEQGFRTPRALRNRIPLGIGLAGRAVRERKTLHIDDMSKVADASAAGLEGEQFVSCWVVPLQGKRCITGALRVFHRGPLEADEDWQEFLDMLAGQIAIAVDNAALFENLQRTNEELMQAYDKTIEGWSHALDLRDKETEGHTLRVTEMSLRLARVLGLPESQMVHIRRGALLHDIGKMGIPDQILLKPAPLTDPEWQIMRKHPVYAYEMLSPIQFLHAALDIPYCHHEKWDGTGYPRGLQGEQIPLAARLFSVIDVWDALRSDRPYRRGWSDRRVREHIASLSGTHFDPQVVEAFLRLLEQDEADGLADSPVERAA